MSRKPILGTLLAALAAAAVYSAPNAAAWTPEDARLAACDFATEISSYDSATLDDYFQRVLARSTGEFATSFAASIPSLRKSIQQVQARSWLETAECASAGGDLLRQRVLIYLVAIRTNAVEPEPYRQVIPVTATMENVWGRWLVSEVDSPAL